MAEEISEGPAELSRLCDTCNCVIFPRSKFKVILPTKQMPAALSTLRLCEVPTPNIVSYCP